jgi:hypothetical protein
MRRHSSFALWGALFWSVSTTLILGQSSVRTLNAPRPSRISPPSGQLRPQTPAPDGKPFAEIRKAISELFSDLTGLDRSVFEVRWDFRSEGIPAAIVTTEAQKDQELKRAMGRSDSLRKALATTTDASNQPKVLVLISPRLISWAMKDIELKDPVNGTSEIRPGDDSRLRYVLLHEFFHEVSSGRMQAVLDDPENWKDGAQPEWKRRLKRKATESEASKGYEIYSDLKAQEVEIARGGNPDAGIEMTEVLSESEHVRGSLASELQGSHPNARTRLDFLQADKLRLRRIGIYRLSHDNYQRSNRFLRQIDGLVRSPLYQKQAFALIEKDLAAWLSHRLLSIATAPASDQKDNRGNTIREALDPSDGKFHPPWYLFEPYGDSFSKAYESFKKISEIRFKPAIEKAFTQRLEELGKQSPKLDRIALLSTLHATLDPKSKHGWSPQTLQKLKAIESEVNAPLRADFARSFYETNFEEEILSTLPDDYVRDWLEEAMRQFRKAPTEEKAAILLDRWMTKFNRVNKEKKGEKQPIRDFLALKSQTETLRNIATLFPQTIAKQLPTIHAIERQLPADERDQLHSVFQAAANRWDVETLAATHPDFTADLLSFMNAAHEMKLDLKVHTPALRKVVETAFLPENLKNYELMEDFSALVKSHSDMATAAEPVLRRYIDLGVLSLKDRDQFHSLLEKFTRAHLPQDESEDARTSRKQFERELWGREHGLSQLIQSLLNQKELYPLLRSELDNLDTLWRDEAKALVAELVALPQNEFVEAAKDAIQIENEHDPATKITSDDLPSGLPPQKLNRKAQSEIARTQIARAHILPRTPNSYWREKARASRLSAAFNYAFRHHRQFPTFINRLKDEKSAILNTLIDSYWSGVTDEHSHFFKTIWKEEEVVSAFLKQASLARVNQVPSLAQGIRHRFGIELRPSHFASLDLPFLKKVELLLASDATTIHSEDTQALLRITAQGEKELIAGKIDFDTFFDAARKLFPQDDRQKGIAGVALHAIDKAFHSYIEALEKSPRETVQPILETFVFKEYPDGDKYQKEAIRLLDRIVPSNAIDDRLAWYHGTPPHLEDEKPVKVEGLRSTAVVDSLVQNILESSAPLDQKLNWIGSLRDRLNERQMAQAWNSLAHEGIYNAAFIPERADQVIKAIYGDYKDGMARRMNEVMEHYELNEEDLKGFRRKVFGESQIAAAYKQIEVIRLAVEHSLSDSVTHLDFLRWLQGKTQATPKMAEKIVDNLERAADEYYEQNVGKIAALGVTSKDAFREQVAERTTPQRMLDTYRNSPAMARAAMISPIFSSNQEKGMFAKSEGVTAFTEFVTDGMSKANRPLASALLRSYLGALGREAHLFAAQMVAGSSVKEDSKNDAEKLKTLIENKGALWIKMGQALYADKHLIPEDSTREIFRTLLDAADKPYRERLFSMLREELGQQYEKILHVQRVLGAGSVNISVGVQLKNEKRYVARFVRDDPWAEAESELSTIQKMIVLLEKEARESEDPHLTEQLSKVRLSLGEHLDGIAQKLKVEADLTIDRRVTDDLRRAGTYDRDEKDLKVSVRLVTEALDTGIEYQDEKDPQGVHANARRVILYEFIPNEFDSFSPAEKRRAMQAALRAEYHGLFTLGVYDPDGHRGNWRFFRGKNGVIEARRFDTSQTEVMDPTLRLGFKQLLSELATEARPERIAKQYTSLLDFAAAPETIENAVKKSIKQGSLSGNPVIALMDLHALVKDEVKEPIKLKFPVRMALKSLHTSQQLLDLRDPKEAKLAKEEFLRYALDAKYPKIALQWDRLASWWKGKKKSESATPRSDFEHSEKYHAFIDQLASMKKSSYRIDGKQIALLEEQFESAPHYRKAILETLEAALDHPLDHRTDQNATSRVLTLFQKHSLPILGKDPKEFLAMMAKQGHLESLEILVDQNPEWVEKNIGKWLQSSYQLATLLKHRPLYSNKGYLGRIEKAILDALPQIPIAHLAGLDLNLFTRIPVPLGGPTAFVPPTSRLYDVWAPHRSSRINSAIARKVLHDLENLARTPREDWSEDQAKVAPIELPFWAYEGAFKAIFTHRLLNPSEGTRMLAAYLDIVEKHQPDFQEAQSIRVPTFIEQSGMPLEYAEALATHSRRQDIALAAAKLIAIRAKFDGGDNRATNDVLDRLAVRAPSAEVRTLAAKTRRNPLDASVEWPESERLELPPQHLLIRGKNGGKLLYLGPNGDYRTVFDWPEEDGDYYDSFFGPRRDFDSPEKILAALRATRTLAGRFSLSLRYNIHWRQNYIPPFMHAIGTKEAKELAKTFQWWKTASKEDYDWKHAAEKFDDLLRYGVREIDPKAIPILNRLLPTLHVETIRDSYWRSAPPEEDQRREQHLYRRLELYQKVREAPQTVQVAEQILRKLSETGLVDESLSKFLEANSLDALNSIHLNREIARRQRDKFHGEIATWDFISILSKLRFQTAEAALIAYREWRNELGADYTHTGDHLTAHSKKKLEDAIERFRERASQDPSLGLPAYEPYSCDAALYRLNR